MQSPPAAFQLLKRVNFWWSFGPILLIFEIVEIFVEHFVFPSQFFIFFQKPISVNILFYSIVLILTLFYGFILLTRFMGAVAFAWRTVSWIFGQIWIEQNAVNLAFLHFLWNTEPMCRWLCVLVSRFVLGTRGDVQMCSVSLQREFYLHFAVIIL